MRSLPLRLGCAYSFLYPRYNYVGLPARTESRRVVVESIRDTYGQPLQSQTVSLNPLLRRSRWLVTGYDLDRDERRSFYADSMTEIRPLTQELGEPFRNAEYVVLTPIGRALFQSVRLGEAMEFLLEKSAGILCKVLGSIRRGETPDVEPPRPAAP